MLTENIIIKEEYHQLGEELYGAIFPKRLSEHHEKIVIGIGGESGSGKSTTAICLLKELKRQNKSVYILHMDSYFKLPPQENHQERRKDLSNVGPQEVNLDLMNTHIKAFKNDDSHVLLPNINYLTNKFTHNSVNFSQFEVLIVEGVYTFLLNDLSIAAFMQRTFKDTFETRVSRTREKYDPFVEKVLEIEHQIISPMMERADFLIDKNYKLVNLK